MKVFIERVPCTQEGAQLSTRKKVRRESCAEFKTAVEIVCNLQASVLEKYRLNGQIPMKDGSFNCSQKALLCTKIIRLSVSEELRASNCKQIMGRSYKP
eukprot:scaffold105355_cov17-Tisochrysis_lutea.AAC.2